MGEFYGVIHINMAENSFENHPSVRVMVIPGWQSRKRWLWGKGDNEMSETVALYTLFPFQIDLMSTPPKTQPVVTVGY